MSPEEEVAKNLAKQAFVSNNRTASRHKAIETAKSLNPENVEKLLSNADKIYEWLIKEL